MPFIHKNLILFLAPDESPYRFIERIGTSLLLGLEKYPYSVALPEGEEDEVWSKLLSHIGEEEAGAGEYELEILVENAEAGTKTAEKLRLYLRCAEDAQSAVDSLPATMSRRYTLRRVTRIFYEHTGE